MNDLANDVLEIAKAFPRPWKITASTEGFEVSDSNDTVWFSTKNNKLLDFWMHIVGSVNTIEKMLHNKITH